MGRLWQSTKGGQPVIRCFCLQATTGSRTRLLGVAPRAAVFTKKGIIECVWNRVYCSTMKIIVAIGCDIFLPKPNSGEGSRAWLGSGVGGRARK